MLLTGFADGIILKSGTPVWESAAAAGADAACLAAAAAAAVVIICSLVCEISAGHSALATQSVCAYVVALHRRLITSYLSVESTLTMVCRLFATVIKGRIYFASSAKRSTGQAVYLCMSRSEMHAVSKTLKCL